MKLPRRTGPVDRDPFEGVSISREPMPYWNITPPDADQRWKNALNYASQVLDVLQTEVSFEAPVLKGVVSDLVNGTWTPDDIIALYRHRMTKQ
jgi:hypothetical protein